MKQSIVLLQDLSTKNDFSQESTEAAMDRVHHNMGSLADRVSLITVASEIHQVELLDVINVFIDQFRTPELFASLPWGSLSNIHP